MLNKNASLEKQMKHFKSDLKAMIEMNHRLRDIFKKKKKKLCDASMQTESETIPDNTSSSHHSYAKKY